MIYLILEIAEIRATLEIEKALELCFNKVKNSKYEINEINYDYVLPSSYFLIKFMV